MQIVGKPEKKHLFLFFIFGKYNWTRKKDEACMFSQNTIACVTRNTCIRLHSNYSFDRLALLKRY